MKKIVFILTIAALLFSISSCGNKKKKAAVGTHTHEDGTVHADDAHSHDSDAKPAQEAFEVKADNDAEHKHEAGDHDTENHEHGTETGDEHDHDHGEHN